MYELEEGEYNCYLDLVVQRVISEDFIDVDIEEIDRQRSFYWSTIIRRYHHQSA